MLVIADGTADDRLGDVTVPVLGVPVLPRDHHTTSKIYIVAWGVCMKRVLSYFILYNRIR